MPLFIAVVAYLFVARLAIDRESTEVHVMPLVDYCTSAAIIRAQLKCPVALGDTLCPNEHLIPREVIIEDQFNFMV